MVEEAAGTKLYETKRQTVLKTISKKDEKLCDMTTVSNRIFMCGYVVNLVICS